MWLKPKGRNGNFNKSSTRAAFNASIQFLKMEFSTRYHHRSNQLIVHTECAVRQKELIVRGCATLPPSEYTNRHNKVPGYIHWKIYKRVGVTVL
jgi:hypothetical protein